MLRYHIKRHKYKIVIGLPIAVLLASSLSFLRDPQDVCIVPDDSRYVAVGEDVTLHVMADADEPVNVIGGDVSYPPDLLVVDSISRDASIIDLWSEEPSAEGGRIRFSGGIVSDGGFIGNAVVLTLHVRPIAPGQARLAFDDVHMLAHDGTGMEVSCSGDPLTLTIRAADLPSPDVNGDHHVNLLDFGLVSARLFLAYSSQYDLNNDGRITLADLGIVLSNLGSGGRMGGLALLWYR